MKLSAKRIIALALVITGLVCSYLLGQASAYDWSAKIMHEQTLRLAGN